MLGNAAQRSASTVTGMNALLPAQILAVALRVAADAHAGQVDAGGAPYMGHLNRVMARAEALRSLHARHLEPHMVQAAAVLHDSIEDTAVTADYLREVGLPDDVVNAVELLTHAKGQPRAEYLAALTASPIAVLVKLADTLDNGDEVRLREVGKKEPAREVRLRSKYAGAAEYLRGQIH